MTHFRVEAQCERTSGISSWLRLKQRWSCHWWWNNQNACLLYQYDVHIETGLPTSCISIREGEMENICKLDIGYQQLEFLAYCAMPWWSHFEFPHNLNSYLGLRLRLDCLDRQEEARESKFSFNHLYSAELISVWCTLIKRLNVNLRSWTSSDEGFHDKFGMVDEYIQNKI